ncbi:hypothetical protein BGZ96_002740 [Linnemannia gamsii]|uniref:Uncharacterized protein n=1 Tax=Linnemannia gamsii TaxID=64522 RepID=A0ABQ7K8H2_9FUNG|nr:hypothetical protein BGZ96_002740 [Linnemannia gamsii]
MTSYPASKSLAPGSAYSSLKLSAMFNSAARIRTLTIDIADADWFLNNPTSPCINLQELYCVDYDYQPKDLYVSEESMSNVDQTKNALLLVEANPKLLTLSVEHNERTYRDDHFTESIFKSLASHKSLARIHISLASINSTFRYTLFNNLPGGLRDFEFCYRSLHYTSDDWNEDGVFINSEPELITTVLTALERLCLRGPQKQLTSHWQEEVFTPSPFSPARRYIDSKYLDLEATVMIRRSPRLQNFILRGHYGKLKDLVQLLVVACPDLETIDISSADIDLDADDLGENNVGSDATTEPTTTLLTTRCYFTKLKEFRIEGAWSQSTNQAIVKLVSRSADTLEIAWFDCGTWWVADEFMNPFQIDTETSWTLCTQLKELVLYYQGGFSMSAYYWDTPSDHSHATSDTSEDKEDYSVAFSRLEKLRLSVKEPLWQGCSDGFHTGQGEWSAEEYDGLQPITHEAYTTTPNGDICVRELERATERKEREHQLAFVLQVRELYGRLKNFKRLRALEIEWCACSTIRDMTLEDVLRLFYETEFDEDKAKGVDFKRREDLPRTRKGWWGPITSADISWLGLSWSTQTEQKAEADLQQLVSIARDNSSFRYNLASSRIEDPFHRRVGRVWEDWMYLTEEYPHHWNFCEMSWNL